MNSFSFIGMQPIHKSLCFMFLIVLCTWNRAYGQGSFASDSVTNSSENALVLAKSEFDKGQ